VICCHCSPGNAPHHPLTQLDAHRSAISRACGTNTSNRSKRTRAVTFYLHVRTAATAPFSTGVLPYGRSGVHSFTGTKRRESCIRQTLPRQCSGRYHGTKQNQAGGFRHWWGDFDPGLKYYGFNRLEGCCVWRSVFPRVNSGCGQTPGCTSKAL
jgi:hypothetical protein